PMWTNKDVGGRILRLVLFAGTGFVLIWLASKDIGLPYEESGITAGLRLYGYVLGLFVAAMPFLLNRDILKPEPARVTMDGGMGFWRAILALIVMLILVILPLKASGASGAKPCGSIDCDPFVNPAVAQLLGEGAELTKGDTKRLEQESRQRGVQLFANYCMGCHSAK
ncbi:MAG: hypothetical protein OIF34_06105, partial [Porticoccaceae bacterium]|nr:hypothetical protein [Porticoccaceae bacterium]